MIAAATVPGSSLRKAFAMKPQLIYFLTDGHFSPQLREVAQKLNREGRVHINTIAFVNREPSYEDQLKRAGECKNGGVYFTLFPFEKQKAAGEAVRDEGEYRGDFAQLAVLMPQWIFSRRRTGLCWGRADAGVVCGGGHCDRSAMIHIRETKIAMATTTEHLRSPIAGRDFRQLMDFMATDQTFMKSVSR